MLLIIISLLITIASFYVLAYLYKIDHKPPKVTVGDVFDEYTVLIVGIIIGLYFLLRNKSDKTKKIVCFVLIIYWAVPP